MEKSGFTRAYRFRTQTRHHVYGSQKLYSIDHLFRCNNIRIEGQPPDTFTQSQAMHIYENQAAVVVTSAVDLHSDLDKVRIVCENHGSEPSGLSQLIVVSYPDLLLVMCRRRLHSAAAQTFGDPHVHVLIGVNF